jgi:hypothetical protein
MVTTPWKFQGEPIEELPKGYEGFVYLIRNLVTGQLYIGKKYCRSVRKVKGKSRRVGTESDWRDYWSSSDTLKKQVEDLGQENFERHILVFTKTRGDASRIEEQLLWRYNVLEDDRFLNASIGNTKPPPQHIKESRKWGSPLTSLLSDGAQSSP